MGAKQEATKKRRLEKLIEHSRNGERVPAFVSPARRRAPGAVLWLDRLRSLLARRRPLSAADHAAAEGKHLERCQHQALPGAGPAGPDPPERKSGVREKGRSAVKDLLVRKPFAGPRSGERGCVSQAQGSVAIFRDTGPVVSNDCFLLGDGREAGGNQAAAPGKAHRALAERRARAGLCEPCSTSRSFTRALTRLPILATGSGSSSGNLRVDFAAR